MWLGIPLAVIFPRAVREPAHNNRCGLLPRKGCTPMFVNKVVFLWNVCTITVKRHSDHSVCKTNVKKSILGSAWYKTDHKNAYALFPFKLEEY